MVNYRKLFALLVCTIHTGVFFAQNAVIPDTGHQGWMLQTEQSVYQVTVTETGDVLPVYYGHKAHVSQWKKQDRTRHNGPYAIYEVPVRGKYADKMPVVEVLFPDGTRECELTFVSAEMVEIDARQTLRIIQKDKVYPMNVVSYIRVLPEYDMLEKWIEVENTGRKGNIRIENLMSASVNLPQDRYFLNHHSGQWLREFQLQKTELTTGIKTLQGRDFYSFQNTPWYAVTPQENDDEHNCPVWFGQLHYSGNWRIDFESTHSNHLQIVAGINFWDTTWELKPGERFTTPKMSFGFTTGGTEDAARKTAAYVRYEVLRPKARKSNRKVLYNSWYATAFDVNEEQQVALASVARELGVELFVIDDGWFRGRKTDHAGLGDWTVDKEKFPDGLNPLIKKINDMGMDFGIWVEPEMINPNSDLYRKHPDWVLHYPDRTRTEWRYQLTLNLAREDVYQYLLQSMSDLLSNHNIKFIKWDRNRGLTEPGWPAAPLAMQREVRIRYMQNLYRMIAELEKRFPDVEFENCSSGGGRPDLGMLSLMDQTWASDNTDPVDRLFIQYGYLSAYPAGTMVCWTNSSDAHRIRPSLGFTFDVAMAGVLGIGQNISKWDAEQMATARAKIAEYKQIRPLIQQGTLYRLKSPFKGNKVALQYVSDDAGKAVVLCYNLGESMEGTTNETRQQKRLQLEGLDPDRTYKVDTGGKETEYTGEFLMNIGIEWPVRGAYQSRIVKLEI